MAGSRWAGEGSIGEGRREEGAGRREEGAGRREEGGGSGEEGGGRREKGEGRREKPTPGWSSDLGIESAYHGCRPGAARASEVCAQLPTRSLRSHVQQSGTVEHVDPNLTSAGRGLAA
jgi:hypothetical protein